MAISSPASISARPLQRVSRAESIVWPFVLNIGSSPYTMFGFRCWAVGVELRSAIPQHPLPNTHASVDPATTENDRGRARRPNHPCPRAARGWGDIGGAPPPPPPPPPRTHP